MTRRPARCSIARPGGCRQSTARELACLTALLACLLPGGARLAAQETSGSGGDAEQELGTITLENSRHVANPAFTDEMPDELEDLPEPPESNVDRLRRLFRLYRDAVADSMYGEADMLAKQIVELSIETYGRNSKDTARAITNLGIAQHGSGDYESAELNFKAAIDIVERVSDRLNKDLINPLKGLAASQLAQGKAVPAAETFNRAVHISHVNYGPHNLEQVEMLESLAETYLAAGELDMAIDMQERIFALQARNVEPDSAEMLPALRTQARWLHRLQLFDKERYTWRRVISILEDQHGKGDLSLIEPLTELGQSYLYLGTSDISYHQPTANTTGEIYLKRALRIAEDHPDADWETEASAMLSLADYYIMTSKPNRAERVYADAWELLSANDDRLPARRDKLQTLPVLQDIQPPKFYGIEDSGIVPARPPDGFETGTVVYSYSVSERGTPTNIQLVEAQPSSLEEMQTAVSRKLRQRVQRPQVIDGATVQTDNLTFSHDFFYRSSDLPEATTAAGDVPH